MVAVLPPPLHMEVGGMVLRKGSSRRLRSDQ